MSNYLMTAGEAHQAQERIERMEREAAEAQHLEKREQALSVTLQMTREEATQWLITRNREQEIKFYRAKWEAMEALIKNHRGHDPQGCLMELEKLLRTSYEQ